ncbi:hypothetical protein EV291_10794 [Rhizobium sp. BK068]|nr:hypothetical protein EV291_10794 [Rhizobium sp. BK068]
MKAGYKKAALIRPVAFPGSSFLRDVTLHRAVECIKIGKEFNEATVNELLMAGARMATSGSIFAKSRNVSAMREDVGFFPAEQIELGACRKEFEAGIGVIHAAVAHQPFRQLVAQRMQIEHIRGGVFQLCLR